MRSSGSAEALRSVTVSDSGAGPRGLTRAARMRVEQAVRIRAGAVHGEGVPGDVVGVPGLALEGEEDADPPGLCREVEEQATVLPDAVVALEAPAVALVHVDVVDAVPGQEAEDLVADGGLGPEALAEHVRPGGRIGHRALDVVVEQIGQVVVGALRVRGQRTHRRRVEEVAAHEVKVRAARPRRQCVPAGRQALQVCREGVLEVVGDQVEQLGGLLLGPYVDRCPVVRPLIVRQVDLVVRGVGGALAPDVDRPGDQYAVGLQWHVGQLPLQAVRLAVL